MAIAACVLWLVGFEAMPWLHVAYHDELAPHVHTADGQIVLVTGEAPAHRHADGTIHRDAPVSSHRHRGSTPGYGLDHGSNSLAHHGVAAIPAPPLLHKPLPIDLRPTTVAIAPTGIPTQAQALAATARGPPPAPAARV